MEPENLQLTLSVVFAESMKDFFSSAKFLIYMGHALSTWVSEAVTLMELRSGSQLLLTCHVRSSCLCV